MLGAKNILDCFINKGRFKLKTTTLLEDMGNMYNTCVLTVKVLK